MKDPLQSTAWVQRSDGDVAQIQRGCAIGRSTINDLILTEDRVSRRHALIHAQGEREFWLVDLGSSNGTYLNQRRVSQPVRLRDGDAIQIGPFALVFRQSPKKAPVPAPERTATKPTAVEVKSAPCWLLVADIAGSTQLATRLKTEEMAVLAGRWFLDCKETIETGCGTVNKYLGDGFLAYWPADQVSADGIVSVLQRLRRLQDAGKPAFRMVLHHGKVTMGGVPSLGEESLSGKEVNFVFRMERLASELEKARLISEAGHALLAGKLPGTDAGNHRLDGFRGGFRFLEF
jgi:pSer/pThr/pTyr-binding forkhead associated (FHA) protein